MNFLDALPEGVWLTLKGGGRIAADAETQRAIAARPGVEIRIGIRAEDIHPGPEGIKHHIRLSGSMVLREPLGHETLTHFRLDGAPDGAYPLVARGSKEFPPGADGSTPLFLDATRLHIFWKDTGQRLEARVPSEEPSTGTALS
jgi:hypothetical protein